MTAQPLTGTRIRERRLDQGLRQADLAQVVAISPSYLNLIEHNKRRIGTKLLGALAHALKVDPTTLSQGADPAVLDYMQAAAARAPGAVEVVKTEELASRYPGWAALIAAQEALLDQRDAEIRLLRDRMTHDPALASALHNVITAVTSIRATAGILVSDDKVDADWQRRFHININDDARRLADQSDALITYLDAPQSDETLQLDGAEEVDTLFAADTDLTKLIEAKNVAVPLHLNTATTQVYKTRINALREDAKAIPQKALSAALGQGPLDPAALARQFDVPLAQVLRRLAYLPATADSAAMGLVVCDGAGAITTLKPIAGFAMSRRTNRCPLWPIFTALSQPGRPIRSEVILPDTAQTRFLCFAVADPVAIPDFDLPPVMQATMLIVPDPAHGQIAPTPVGTSCKVCPRADCLARSEVSVLGKGI